MHHDQGHCCGTSFLTFLAGAVVGASLALVFAPQSGKKTRRRISETAEDLKDYAADFGGKIKAKIT